MSEESESAETTDAQNSLNSRLMKGGTCIVLGRLIGTALGFISNAILARSLRDGFGTFGVAVTLLNCGGILSRLGMDRTIIRFAGQALALNHKDAAKRSLVLGLRIAVANSFVVAILAWLVFPRIAERLGIPAEIAKSLPIGIFLLALLHVCSESMRSFHENRLPALFAAYGTGPLLNIVFLALIATVSTTSDRLITYFNCYQLSILLLLPFAIFALTKVAKLGLKAAVPKPASKMTLDIQTKGTVKFASMLSVGSSIAGSDTLQFLLAQSHILIAGAFCNSTEVDNYNAARLLNTLVATPLFLANQAVASSIPELHIQRRQSDLQRTLQTTATFAAIPTLMVSALFFLVPVRILELAFGDGFGLAAPLLMALTIGNLFFAWTGPCALTLSLTGEQNLVLVVNILAGAVLLIGGSAAAVGYGAIGLALVAAAVQAVSNMALWWLTRRNSGVWTNATVNLASLRLPKLFRMK